MKIPRFKIDYYLILISALIITVFNKSSLAFLFIIPFIAISYYRIVIKRDITAVLIIILSSRLIMGPFLPGNNTSFNILNLLCNYLPIFIAIFYNYLGLKRFEVKIIFSLKWTIAYVIFLFVFGLLLPRYSLSVVTHEVLPLLLFLILAVPKADQKINYDYLIKFFRYAFIACLLIYLNPNFGEQMQKLFSEGIIFKQTSPDISLFVKRIIPRNTGFVFDFRIMGQLACIYLLLLYYRGKKSSYFDLALLITITIITFSRGPIIVLALVLFAIYGPKKIYLTKRNLIIGSVTFCLMLGGVIYLVRTDNEIIKRYVATYNPFSKNSAIAQRGGFAKYSLNEFYKNPLGNGLGYLSSKEAGHKIFTGYTNSLHKKIPDKVYYYRVTDAYITMSLGEKGLIGFILFLLSFFEIFFSNRNRVALFFLLGLLINLIGTDIPKQGFYYFAIMMIYFGISQKKVVSNYDEGISQ